MVDMDFFCRPEVFTGARIWFSIRPTLAFFTNVITEGKKWNGNNFGKVSRFLLPSHLSSLLSSHSASTSLTDERPLSRQAKDALPHTVSQNAALLKHCYKPWIATPDLKINSKLECYIQLQRERQLSNKLKIRCNTQLHIAAIVKTGQSCIWFYNVALLKHQHLCCHISWFTLQILFKARVVSLIWQC